jgi:hypothetical protein
MISLYNITRHACKLWKLHLLECQILIGGNKIRSDAASGTEWMETARQVNVGSIPKQLTEVWKCSLKCKIYKRVFLSKRIFHNDIQVRFSARSAVTFIEASGFS